MNIKTSLQTIKSFTPLPAPKFTDNDKDSYDHIVWNLYHRICEAINSFTILFEKERYYDSFIIAGHALETCAILSYITDNPTVEKCQKRYNKYLASATLGRLKYVLELFDNFDKDFAWKTFIDLLEIFKTVDTYIIKYNRNRNEAIKRLSQRESSNKEKIYILNDYYSKIRVRKYINILIQNTSSFGGDEFDRFYQKYCDIKHSNMLSPGASFKDNHFDVFAEDGIYLISGIIYYLQNFKF